MKLTHLKAAACALLFIASPLLAGEAPRRQEDPKIRKGPVYISEEQAPWDYKVQGEYVGQHGDNKVGVQVIALGKDEFRAVFFGGGLPGDGWDGKQKKEVPGKWAAERVSFAAGDAKSFSLVIDRDGQTASGATERGENFQLKKVSRQSPTLGAKPPAGAILLFDGSGTDAWQPGKMNDAKLLMVPASTKQKFTDFTAHIEFILPFMPQARGQDRGNSGVYPQGRYEIQVLDSFGLKGENNECGGIYRTAAPKVNMCFPPLVWQTYDIDFTAPKYEGDKKTANAKVTIRHNGVLIHENQEIEKETGGGNAGREGPTPGPLYFQDHGDQVFYRNVWIVEKK